ncbi:hypothetical protein L2E82_06329 [Cichorium intybus]|uniref:Uncharacterized protein n=1 Tax=Cichorium intybus TaxID=13427 RepID=A0ACB9H9K3_CICIN|nr:hypothetical protein L2E82_06329 [Cichorium intybus]
MKPAQKECVCGAIHRSLNTQSPLNFHHIKHIYWYAFTQKELWWWVNKFFVKRVEIKLKWRRSFYHWRVYVAPVPVTAIPEDYLRGRTIRLCPSTQRACLQVWRAVWIDRNLGLCFLSPE